MKKAFFIPRFSGLLAALLTLSANGADSTVQEKINVTIELTYVKDVDGKCYIDVNVFHKVKKRFIPVEGRIINIYLNGISREGMMGNTTTDENGEGRVNLGTKFYKARDSLYQYTFIGRLANDKEYEDEQTELTIRDAILSIELLEEDSVRTVKATLLEKNDSVGRPVPDAEIYFYVKRAFSLLPLTEDILATDENGEVMLEFPANLAGDSSGNLSIIARTEGHYKYTIVEVFREAHLSVVTRTEGYYEFGTVQALREAKWGIPQKPNTPFDRELWASRANAPLWLITVSNSIIFGVWFVIFYIVFQLFRLASREETKIHE